MYIYYIDYFRSSSRITASCNLNVLEDAHACALLALGIEIEPFKGKTIKRDRQLANMSTCRI